MREVYTYGKIEKGVLKITRRAAFLEAIRSLPDGRVTVTIAKQYKRRSVPENAYYWGVVVNEFVQGWFDTNGEKVSIDRAHWLLKQECNSIEVINQKTGKIIKCPQDTHTMTTVEFEAYLTDCRRFIAEWFGREVPLPNEQLEIFNQ